MTLGMTLEEAKAILGARVQGDSLDSSVVKGFNCWVMWNPGRSGAWLDGEDYTADQLEAIAVFMRAKR